MFLLKARAIVRTNDMYLSNILNIKFKCQHFCNGAAKGKVKCRNVHIFWKVSFIESNTELTPSNKLFTFS